MRCAAYWQLVWILLVLCIPRLADARGETKAAPFRVTLEYEAPDQCLGAHEFRAIVKKRLGRDPFVEASTDRVLVLVSQVGGALSGDIMWRDARGSSSGQQRFPSTSNHCAQLIEAMAFALAVQIQLLETEVDQKSTATSPEGSGAPATPAMSVPSPPPAGPARDQPSVASSPSEHPRRPMAVFLGGGGALAFGMSSQIVPVGRLFAGLSWTAVAIELGLEASFPVMTRRADGAGFSQWYLVSSAAACAVFRPVSACALLKVGTVHVSGRDIDVPRGAGAALAQSGLRLALNQRLTSSASLSIRAEGLVNLTRWSVTLDQNTVWSASPFAAASGLDFMVLFQ